MRELANETAKRIVAKFQATTEIEPYPQNRAEFSITMARWFHIGRKALAKGRYAESCIPQPDVGTARCCARLAISARTVGRADADAVAPAIQSPRCVAVDPKAFRRARRRQSGARGLGEQTNATPACVGSPVSRTPRQPSSGIVQATAPVGAPSPIHPKLGAPYGSRWRQVIDSLAQRLLGRRRSYRPARQRCKQLRGP